MTQVHNNPAHDFAILIKRQAKLQAAMGGKVVKAFRRWKAKGSPLYWKNATRVHHENVRLGIKPQARMNVTQKMLKMRRVSKKQVSLATVNLPE